MSAEDKSINDKPSLFSLRVAPPNIEENKWPCPDDKLGRHKEIENLTPVLLNVEAPLVLAIDAPWGAGKTTFIELWQKYLETEGKVGLYINCWENDFVDDPLLPMLSAMDSWLSHKDSSSAVANAWGNAKKLVPGLIKSAAIAATKAGTLGALDIGKEYEKILSDMAGGAIADLVDTFNVQKKVVEEFKRLVLEAMVNLPADQKNLIIFIDELDRCRPTYAIEVLERVKHLFNLERVVFVIGINRKQLSKSLQGVYGPSFDGEHYLKRFIDLDYQLTVLDQIGYINHRMAQSDIKDYFDSRQNGSTHLETFSRLIKGLVQRFDYQLRDIDQLIMRIRLVLKSIPKKDELDLVVLASLLVLRENNKDLYQRFKKDSTSVNEVIKFLIGDVVREDMPEYFPYVAGWLILSAKDSYNPERLNITMDYWNDLLEKQDIQSEKYRQINRVLETTQTSLGIRDYDNLRLLTFDRIELMNKITIS